MRHAEARGDARPAVTLALLAVVATSYVLQQTLVVPALPTIQRDLDTSTTWVAWIFTGFLLTSAVATPLLGKLGDSHGKKRILMFSLAGFGAGTVLAALAPSIEVLILARAIQGVGGAIFPLAFGIIRDQLPPHRVGLGLGLLSATFGVGGGAGLVLSGLILQELSWQWLFWIGAAPVAVAMAVVWVLLPESPVRARTRLDWRGALTLSGGLVALLLVLSEGRAWGLLSATTLGTAAAAVALLAAWVAVELRVPEPMVDIGMMRDRAVFWTNLVAFLTGFAMFGTFLMVPQLAQLPRGLPEALAGQVDYGFGATVIVAGLVSLPASLMMLVVGPIAGIMEARAGARTLALAGLTVISLGGLALTLAHDAIAQAVVGMALVGVGVGLTYSMLAKLIVDAVRPEVTGVAMGMNTVMRTIGGSVGGQLGAALLAAYTLPGAAGVPAERGFTIAFGISAVAALAAAAGVLRIPRRGAGAPVGAPAPAAAGRA
jgi:EmrB/QacA subfamily drug resistance transporter